MELYLIRHGIAADKDAYANDQERPLTDKGRKKTDKIAKQLYEHEVRFDLILTSPLIRAKETAAILQEAGLTSQVEEFASLAPDGNIHDWVRWFREKWQTAEGDRTLALVGHQPDLGQWAEILVWGNAQEKLILKKAGIVGLDIPETGTPIAQSQLFLLAPPKWLL